MTELLTSLDARKRGTFLVTTASGQHYVVVASKQLSGRVEFTGGRWFHEPTTGILGGRPQPGEPVREPVANVGQMMHIATADYPHFYSSPIKKIRRIDDLSLEAVEALKEEDRQEFEMIKSLESPPVFLDH